MEQYIKVDRETREKLADIFGCTERFVNMALYQWRKSELACKLRKTALTMGGTLMVEAPAMRTIFESDGTMVQVFPNGARIEIEKSTGEATLKFKGVIAERCGVVTIPQLEELQRRAAEMESFSA